MGDGLDAGDDVEGRGVGIGADVVVSLELLDDSPQDNVRNPGCSEVPRPVANWSDEFVSWSDEMLGRICLLFPKGQRRFRASSSTRGTATGIDSSA